MIYWVIRDNAYRIRSWELHCNESSINGFKRRSTSWMMNLNQSEHDR